MNAGLFWHSPEEAQAAHSCLSSTQFPPVVQMPQESWQLASINAGFDSHSPEFAQRLHSSLLSAHEPGVDGDTVASDGWEAEPLTVGWGVLVNIGDGAGV
jgi:hypothetical protein